MILYLVTAAIFLIIDAVMLTVVMKPLFTRHIGEMMRDSLMLTPAAAFYLAYVAGLVVLISAPRCGTRRRGARPGKGRSSARWPTAPTSSHRCRS